MRNKTNTCKFYLETYIQGFRGWVSKGDIERYIKMHHFLADTGNRILRKLTQNNSHEHIEKKEMKGRMYYKWFK